MRTMRTMRLHVIMAVACQAHEAESNGGASGVSRQVRYALGKMDETWTLEIRSGKRGSQTAIRRMRE